MLKRCKHFSIIAVVVGVAIILGVVLRRGPYGPIGLISICFNWTADHGFSDIRITWPASGPGYSRIITAQAKPKIVSYIRDRKHWTAAEGNIDMEVLLWFIVSRPAWAQTRILDPTVTPLMHAVDRGDVSAIRRLLSKRENAVDAQDQDGRTALRHAVDSGHEAAVVELLAAGANPNIRDRTGVTPFIAAAGGCQVRAAGDLLAAGADPDAKDNAGYTAISKFNPPCKQEIRMLVQARRR